MIELKMMALPPDQAQIINEILAELERATEKHPTWPTCNVKRAAIVIEEAGEVIREANHLDEGHGSMTLLRTEVVQTAATCLRFLATIRAETENSLTL